MTNRRFSLMLVPEEGRVRSLRIGRGALVFFSFAALGLVALGGWGGWQTWHTVQKDRQINVLNKQIQMAQSRYAEKTRELQSRIDSGHRQMAVYAKDIASIQARLTRLDALGSKLVDKASLDSAEFNFGLQPAYGGPLLAASDIPVGGLDLTLDHLDSQVADLDVQLAAVDYMMEQKHEEQAARPHGWPSEHGWESSGFGYRPDPFTGERAWHNGVDIANRLGAPVLAASRGIVVFAGHMKGFGNFVEIDHGYGYVTRYGHMSSMTVHVGEEVADDQVIGRVGSTGRSTGPHLHYEVHRYGQSLNPAQFLPHS